MLAPPRSRSRDDWRSAGQRRRRCDSKALHLSSCCGVHRPFAACIRDYRADLLRLQPECHRRGDRQRQWDRHLGRLHQPCAQSRNTVARRRGSRLRRRSFQLVSDRHRRQSNAGGTHRALRRSTLRRLPHRVRQYVGRYAAMVLRRMAPLARPSRPFVPGLTIQSKTHPSLLDLGDFPGGAAGLNLSFKTWLVSLNANGSLHTFHSGFSWDYTQPGARATGSVSNIQSLGDEWFTSPNPPTAAEYNNIIGGFTTAVPEPSTLLLLSGGTVLFLFRRRRP